MYVDASTVRRGNKTYTRYLLRESFREAGKVKHRTIANLSQCSACEIEAIRLALTHKHTLADLGSVQEAVQLRQGASVGAVALLYGLAQQIGSTQALGPGREASLALWQVIARVIDQGSRLSAVRLARHHCCAGAVGPGALRRRRSVRQSGLAVRPTAGHRATSLHSAFWIKTHGGRVLVRCHQQLSGRRTE